MSVNTTIKDYIIGDFIELEIGENMSLPTLYALEAIFYLRLQLAQVGWEECEPILNELCRDRFERISMILSNRYELVESLDEKICVLNHLKNIATTLGNVDCGFVIDNHRELVNSQNLTLSQKYRLDNLLDSGSDNIREDIDCLLLEAHTAFDMSILFDIDSLGTCKQYGAVMDLYESLFYKALAESNISEIANLLAVVAFCNSDPDRRQKIKKLTDKLITCKSLTVNLPLPVVRLNSIAGKVYSRIDKITNKYENLSA
ncbi:MAG: hypothetical protein NC102_05050 [Clostridium sp.]|nr:hypothetical protein [Clostridium sp.]